MRHFLTFIIAIIGFLINYSVQAQCNLSIRPDTTICLGSSIPLTNSVHGKSPITYTWNASSDLSCTNCQTPIATPTTTATYTLQITDDTNCVATKNVKITVLNLPNSTFSFSQNNTCSGKNIVFTPSSIVAGNTYSWNFGNPASGSKNTANTAVANHKFVSYGSGNETFTVTLTVTNANGCTSSSTQTVQFGKLPEATLVDPIANFKNCDGSPTFDLMVFDATPNPAQSYEIVWGDGTPNFSSSSAPIGGETHTYTSTDIFELYYIVTGLNGCKDTSTYIVSNITNPAIGAANPGGTTGCAPLSLCFPLTNYTNNHSSTVYYVDYGDNSPIDTIAHANLPTTICHTYHEASCGKPDNAYTFSIKAINPCDMSIATITPIRIYTPPTPEFSNPPVACVNSAVTFQNNTTPGFNSSCQQTTTYKWDFGDGSAAVSTGISKTNPTHSYSTPGTYTITLSVQNSCGTESISHDICIEPVPTPKYAVTPNNGCVPFIPTIQNTSDTSDFCQTTFNWNVVSESSSCGVSNWEYTGGTNGSKWEPKFKFNSAGTYTIRLSLTNSCGTFTLDSVVKTKDKPIVSLPSISPICKGDNIHPTVSITNCSAPITATNWIFTSGSPASASTTDPGTITYNTVGTFNYSVQATNECGSNTANSSIQVTSPPTANVGSSVSFCAGNSTTIGTAPAAGVTYSWSPSLGVTNPNVSTTSASPENNGDTVRVVTYTLTASTSPTCFSTDVITLTINPKPNLTTTNQTICRGDSVNLIATTTTTPMTYTWTAHPDITCTNCPSPKVAPTATAYYNVSVENQYNCQTAGQIMVTVNNLPIVNAGSDLVLCNQPIAQQLVGTPNGGIWSGSPNVTASGVFTPNGNEVVDVVYTYTDPTTLCTNTDTTKITVSNPVVPTLKALDSLCKDATTETKETFLNASPTGGTFTVDGISATTFNPASYAVGLHNIVYSYGSGTCAMTANAQIDVKALPTLLVNNATICVGDTATLNVTSSQNPTTYSWLPNTNISCTVCDNPKVYPTSSTSYTVTGTNVSGCQNTAVSMITVNSLPIVNAGSDLVLCNQPIAQQLIGTPNGGIWSGSPNVTASGVFTPNGNEVVDVVYTYTNPTTLCTNTDTTKITVSNPVVPTLKALDSLCKDATMVTLETFLNASPIGGTFTVDGNSATTFNPASYAVGLHNVVYSYGSGTCAMTANAKIDIKALPTLSVNNATICVGDTANLNVTSSQNPTTYSWLPNTNISCTSCDNPKVYPTSSTSYTVIGTNVSGCQNMAVSMIMVNSLPIVNAGSDLVLCNQPIAQQLIGTPNGGIWSGSPNVTASGVFTPNGNEVVGVVYTYTNPTTLCTNTDTTKITVANPVVPTLKALDSLCKDATAVTLETFLNATPTGGTFTVDGSSATTFNPSIYTVGLHNVVYSYGSGTCAMTANAQIDVKALPTLLVNNATICLGDTTNLNVTSSQNPTTYSWLPNTNISCTACDNPKVYPTSSGTYTVTGTNVSGCQNTAVSMITVNSLPYANAGNDTTLCNQAIGVPLTGQISGGTWSGTNITPSGIFTPPSVGTFTVTYTVGDITTSCSNSDSIKITVVDPTYADAGIDHEACILNNVVNLVGQPAGGTWSGMNITPQGGFSTAQDGVFNLVYSTGAGNCLTTDTMKFTIYPLPIVDAGNDVTLCISDVPINFSATPNGGIYSGTGITNTTTGEFDPATAGSNTHTVYYTYTDPTTTCINKDSLTAVVNPLPTVDFSVAPIVCINSNVNFTNNSSPIGQVTWDFGDGNTSVQTNPTHVYTADGDYTVKLIVTTPNGCIDSISKPITVYALPTANFGVTPDSLCGPLTATFQNNSTGLGVSYAWDFGNGTTSTAQNPTPITYFASNIADTTYIISLTVTNQCTAVTYVDSVKVMPKPTAIFNTNYDVFCSPWQPNFVNTSNGLPDTYSWDFGNGTTSNTSNATFSSPTYTAVGDTTFYTIMLAVSNECGVDTAYKQIAVLPHNVSAFFNTNTLEGCAPLTVNFTQYTVGGINYNWNFGDGNTSSAYSPAHTFMTAGTYQVSLAADNNCSYDTTSVTITVHAPPAIDFTFTPDSTCVYEPFQFTNQSGSMVNYQWNFGDGTTSSLSNPTHAYNASGFYTVTLTGSSTDGFCTASVTKQVYVTIPPKAQFTLNPQIACVPSTVTFTNQSTHYQYSSWDFGDGNTSAQTSPTHTYTTAGVYVVKLIVQSLNGCADTISQYVNVNPVPTAGFTAQPTFACSPNVQATFTNTSVNAIDYNWNFGDGNTSTLLDPIHTFVNAGDYTVRLIVSNQYGCKDTATTLVKIGQTPVADFTMPSAKGCDNRAVIFTSTSQYADSVVWDFGNGVKMTGNNISYVYPALGTYNVTMTAYNNSGCSATKNGSIPITIYPSPTANFEFESNTDKPTHVTVEFTNTSSNYVSSYWDFGNGGTSSEDNPTYDYFKYDDFNVTLVVTNEFGCTDTVAYWVKNKIYHQLYVPNAVNPSHPVYEVSHFLPKGIGIKEYLLQIYDDWGNLVWESSLLDDMGRPVEGWDGTYRGEVVQQDSYVWKIHAIFMDQSVWEGKKYENGQVKRSGTVTVIH